jgi:hypothetical protein
LLIAPDVVWRGNHGGRLPPVRGWEPLVRRGLEKRFRKFLRRVQNARCSFRISQTISFVNFNHLSAADPGDEFDRFSFAQIDGRYQSAVNLVTDSKDMIFQHTIPPGYVARKTVFNRVLIVHFQRTVTAGLHPATGSGTRPELSFVTASKCFTGPL